MFSEIKCLRNYDAGLPDDEVRVSETVRQILNLILEFGDSSHFYGTEEMVWELPFIPTREEQKCLHTAGENVKLRVTIRQDGNKSTIILSQ